VMWPVKSSCCVVCQQEKCCEKLLQAGNDVYGFAMLTLNW